MEESDSGSGRLTVRRSRSATFRWMFSCEVEVGCFEIDVLRTCTYE